ncbi:hypothetical protein [Citricoccus sp.]|uniref:hypothetical protein n=1 Tax=Citricoccus sp. TaxID=1978372 RepID=UPI0028BE9D48|nr:hypothetical protein [Citricoccus sp.]
MTDNPQQPQGTPGSQQPGQQPGQQPPAAPGPLPDGTPAQQPYAAPGQQGSKYGTGSYNPGEVGQTMGEPTSWGRLKMLTLASLAIYVVSGALGIFTAGNADLIDAQLDAQAETMGMSRDQLEAGAEFGMAVGIGLSALMLVIAIVLYLVVFFGLKKVKNWARILGTVLTALGTLFTLWGLTGMGLMMSVAPTMGIISIVITVLFVLVNIWWLVTAFSKDSNAYVNSRR